MKNENNCTCGGNCSCENKDVFDEDYVLSLLNTIASLSGELDNANAEIKRLNGIIQGK